MALTKIDDRGLNTPIDLLDDEKIRFGTDNDLELYHTGSHGYILNKTGNLVIRAKDGETGIEVIPDGAVELRHNNVKKLETTANGIKVNSSTAEQIVLTGANNPYIQWQEGTTNKAYAYWDHSNNWFELKNEETGSKIHIGASTDLYHGADKVVETIVDGLRVTAASNDAELQIRSRNQDGATLIRFASDDGDDNNDWWRIRADGGGNALGIQNYADGAWEANIVCRESGGVELYHDNSKKLETKSDGAEVHGHLYQGDSEVHYLGDSNDFTLWHDGTDCRIRYNHTVGSLKFQKNDNSDVMVIDTSGRVLVGTTTEGHGDADNLTINDTRAGITLRSANDNYGNIYFSDATSGAGEYAGYIQYNHTANRFVIGTNSADEIVIQSGGGISFNGEIAAANALNDYEEGVVTATVANSVTLHSTHDSFSYTKVGRLVTLMGQLRVNSDNSNSVFTITNIPFTSADLTEHADHAAGACRIWSWDINVADHVGVMAFLGGGSTTLDFYVNRDGQSAESLPASAGGYIGFSITYTAA